MIHDRLDFLPISFRSYMNKKKKMRDEQEGRNSGRGNQEIVNKKKWKYGDGEVIIWIN